MDDERQRKDDEAQGNEPREDASRVDRPSGTPPDAGKAYDPGMTEGDEANVPEGSDADPKA
jgi:hypothetical protein